MTEARAHEHNWPLRGALIKRSVDTVYTGAGDFNAVTTGAWTAFARALTLSYTPQVDCIALLLGQVSCIHSLNDQVIGMRIRETAVGFTVVTAYVPSVVSTAYATWNGAAYTELTAGVAYTFAVQYYLFNATLTIVEAADYTFLNLMAFRKP